jgi:hypothetical protein
MSVKSFHRPGWLFIFGADPVEAARNPVVAERNYLGDFPFDASFCTTWE